MSEDNDVTLSRNEKEKRIFKEEESYKFLFIDIEWNQKAGTADLLNREPIQIGLIGTDENLENSKLFSKNIQLADVRTLTAETCKLAHTNEKAVMQAKTGQEVFEKVKMSYAKYKYVVVWTMSTYDLFKLSMEKAGIKLPRHKVLVLQDILNLITLSQGQNLGFETALVWAEIPYEKQFLHYSKHDVQYMYELFKKMYMAYQEQTLNENCFVNHSSKIIHSPECRYLQYSKALISANMKSLIFRGYRPCACCGSEENWRRVYWEPVAREKKEKAKEKDEYKYRDKEIDFRKLPLTDSNIQLICDKFELKCNISEGIVFLSTNCGYWRIYLDGEKVDKVFHGNYRLRRQEFKKRKKCTEGFHKQNIAISNFYDVVKYIYHHDKNSFTSKKKSRIDLLFEQIEQERVMKEKGIKVV